MRGRVRPTELAASGLLQQLAASAVREHRFLVDAIEQFVRGGTHDVTASKP
jgi:hypothetical protein